MALTRPSFIFRYLRGPLLAGPCSLPSPRLAGLLQRLGQADAQQVGTIEAAAAQAHPDPQGHRCRMGAETAGPAGRQRGAGGGGEFPGGKPLTGGQGHGAGPGDLEHGWSRQGQQTMGRADAAVAGGGIGADQLPDLEVQQGGTDPHHIDQRVEGTDFVEVHLLHRLAMHRRFGLRQQGEHREHPFLKRRIQRCCQDLEAQLAPTPVGWVDFQAFHRQVEAAQAAAAALLSHQPIAARQPEGRQGPMHNRRRHAQIQQGAEQHVAGQAGGAIQQG